MRYLFKIILLLTITTLVSYASIAQDIEQERDSILSLIKATTEDTTKANHYIELYELYLYYEPQKGIEYAHKALAHYNTAKFPEGIFRAYDAIFGSHYVKGSKADSLLKYTQLLEEQGRKYKDESLMSKVYFNYGIYYGNIGKPDKELQVYLKSLELVRKYQPGSYEEAVLLNNIGLLYAEEQHLEALKYYRAGLKLEVEAMRGDFLLNTGIIYRNFLEKGDSAQIFYNEALAFFRVENDFTGIANTLMEQGRHHDEREEFELAYQKYTEVESILIEHNINSTLYSLYDDFAYHYFLQEKYTEAISYGEKTIKVAKEQETVYYLDNTYEVMHESYAAIGNFEQAYKFTNKLLVLKDSTSNAALRSRVQELKTEFEVEQKETENQLLKINLKARQQLLIGLIGLIIIILIGGWFAYQFFKNRNEALAQDLENKKTIEMQANELQRLYDYQSKLFTNVAHELQTPLTLIAGPLQNVIAQSQLNKVDREQLSIVNNNVQTLSYTTKQLLDLIKSEKNPIQANVVSFKLVDLINYLQNRFTPLAEHQKVNFQVVNQIDKATMVTSDGEKILIVLRNLLTNAFKFTSAGGQIILSVETKDSRIAIHVKDTGRGIPTEDLQYIFQRYYQSNASTVGGMGIGLAICKEYMQLLKGTIHASSELYKGSTFSITFPTALASTSIINANQSNFARLIQHTPSVNYNDISVQSSSTTKDTILVVEDNPEMSLYIKSLLAKDYTVILASNGQEALKILKQIIPTMIISDIMMPVMDGFTFAKTIKNQDEYRHIPILMLTAKSNQTDRLDAFRIGIDDYLTKPFQQEELRVRVDNICSLQENKVIEQAEKTDHSVITTEITTPQSKISQKDLAFLKKTEQLILDNIDNTNYNINQLVESLPVSYSSFFPTIKRLTGMTPSQYIKEIKLNYARNFEGFTYKRTNLKVIKKNNFALKIGGRRGQ